MKIKFASIHCYDSFTVYEVAPNRQKQKCSSFTIISYLNSKFNENDNIDASVSDNTLTLSSKESKLVHKLFFGNKSLNLLKLWQLGCYIPDTIVLDFNLYDYYKIYGEVDLKTVYNKQVEKRLGSSLAIRCSSNLEDGEKQSFAGVFDTYLDVPNKFDNFKEKILRSYQRFSAQSEEQNDLYKYDLKIGIIVQSMIKPKFSGFLFTSDPMNPTNRWLKIEYWKGEREKSEGYSITLSEESGKRIQIDRDIYKYPLPLSIQKKLVQTAKKLIKNCGFPQDAEFLISDDNSQLYIVQSRPITAFSYSPDKIRLNEQEKLSSILSENLDAYQTTPVLSSTNISELFVRAVPLGYSIFKFGFAGSSEKEGGISLGRSRLGYAKLDLEDQAHFFCTIGDQARTNLIIDALTFRMPGIEKSEYITHFINYYFKQIEIDPNLALYPEDGLYIQNDQTGKWNEIIKYKGDIFKKEYSQFLRRIIDYHAPKEYEKASSFFRENEQFYRSYLRNEFHSASEASLKNNILEILDYLRGSFCPEYVVLARLAFLCTHLAKYKLKNIISTDSPFPLEQILNEILRNVEIEADLHGPNYAYMERLLKANKITLWEFLDKFQHVGSLDIHQPRLGEYSIQELQKIFIEGKLYEYGDGRLQSNNIEREMAAEIETVDLKKNVDFSTWSIFAGQFMRLREKAKFELLKILYILKRTIKELARLHRFGDLIYYLEYKEVLKLTSKKRDEFRLLAMQRKAYFEACNHFRIKDVIIDFQSTPFEKKQSNDNHIEDKRYKVTKGQSIFYGHAEGVCLTAKSNEEYLKKLVAYRDEGIEQIIGVFKGVELSYFNLSALVGFTTENGGYLSHAATIAREFRIPYITGVKMDHFQDGDYLILDTENEQVIYRR